MKNPQQATKHAQYRLPDQAFDAFNQELPTQGALGSKRAQEVQESAEIRSTNWVPNVSGWRLTRRGLELGATSSVFPPGTITFTDIQDIATARLLGRSTAGTGDIEQLTAAQVKTLLAIVAADVSDFTEATQDAVGGAVGNGLDYDDTSGAISVDETELAHNSIGTKQGGTTDEYYHLTAAQNTIVGTLAAGVYTPTRSAESNLDANVTMTEAQYMRVGNTVTVSGRFTADPTAGGAASFEIDLPIASDFAAIEDAAGVAFSGSIAGQGAAISGSVANNTAVFSWIAVDTTSQAWSFSFSYQIIT